MNAIEELKKEHEAVRFTLIILEKIGQQVAESKQISAPEHLDQLFDFFTTFVDRCHHGKEEELLFPALENVGISREGGPIGVMLNEHQQGRNLVKKMKELKDQILNGDASGVESLNESIVAYTRLLNFHIDKENNVLFPMAVRNLPEVKLQELKEGFDKIETEKIGIGKHEAFHKMLDELEEIYL
jgi:hemerythrin-like domain-containing protein